MLAAMPASEFRVLSLKLPAMVVQGPPQRPYFLAAAAAAAASLAALRVAVSATSALHSALWPAFQSEVWQSRPQ